MQIPKGQPAPTAALFQALQGTPRAGDSNAGQQAANPVATRDDSRAVEAASRADRGTAPPKDPDRTYPRGSFINITA